MVQKINTLYNFPLFGFINSAAAKYLIVLSEDHISINSYY